MLTPFKLHLRAFGIDLLKLTFELDRTPQSFTLSTCLLLHAHTFNRQTSASIMDTIKKAIGIDPLPTRQLGKNGPFVTAIGLGLMGLSIGYGDPLPTDQRLAFLDKAYEKGEWFWDSCKRISCIVI
jgi:hypothetical protein